MKKTLVIGASQNPSRYAYKATMMLKTHQHKVVPYGLREGEIDGIKIITEWPHTQDFDTVTLYLNPHNQKELYERILNLKPKRVVFNPGTENTELEQKLENAGIEALRACTLVLLSTGQY